MRMRVRMRKARVSWHIPGNAGQQRQTFKLGSQRTLLPRLIKVCTIPWGLDKSGQPTHFPGRSWGGRQCAPRWVAEQVKLLHGKNGKKNPIFEAILKALRWTQATAIGKGSFLPQLSSFSPCSKGKTHPRLPPTIFSPKHRG